MLIYTASIVIIALLATSCGVEDSSCDSQGQVAGCDASNSTTSMATTTTTITDFVIRGSINSAFSLTVDGKNYDDIEAYFTAENARLPSNVEAAGYIGYSVRFDAAIGFNDLTQGMTVFIAGKEKRGYQTKTLIAKNDTFAAKLPVEAAGDVYQIKASKRINVLLTKDKGIKKFCYNFAAVDYEVTYEKIDAPVILSNFKSSITTYECQHDAGSESLKVPENFDKPAEYSTAKSITTKITIYDSLRDLLVVGMDFKTFNTKLGEAYSIDNSIGLTYESFQQLNETVVYYRFLYSATGGMCEADAKLANSKIPNLGYKTDCFIIMNSKSKVIYQSGIRLEYLSPTGDSWPSREVALAAGVIK